MPFFQRDDACIHYQLAGNPDGLPIVFLNSLGSDTRLWRPFAQVFAAEHRLIFCDKRGHGLSDVSDVPYSMEVLADDVVGLLEHLSLKKVVLMGVSVGGMIALNLAIRYPDRVIAMVLSDTGAKIATPSFWQERIDRVASQGLAKAADGILERWFTKALPQASLRGYRNMLERTPLEGYLGVCAAIRDSDMRAAASGVTTPSLVVVGEEDSSTPPSLNQELAELIPEAEFQAFPGAAHFPCIEAEAPMAARVKRFLAPFMAPSREAPQDTYAKGMATRRAVLGDAHVDRAEADKTSLDEGFQNFITRYAWGEIWRGEAIDTQTRHLITIALMAALGKEHELAMHLRASSNTGLSQEQLQELFLQVAVYSGVPNANRAFAIAKEIFDA